jgi:hypothetical protein
MDPSLLEAPTIATLFGENKRSKSAVMVQIPCFNIIFRRLLPTSSSNLLPAVLLANSHG